MPPGTFYLQEGNSMKRNPYLLEVLAPIPGSYRQ